MITQRLETLKKEVIEYASLVENMIEKNMRGLTTRNKELLSSIIEDEKKANEKEIHIEEMCIQYIAQFEPKAKDLRVVLMVLKMSNDLERMADHSTNIADSSSFLIERREVKPLNGIPDVAEETKKMLNDSIESFIKGDAKLAKTVCERDNIVDDMRDEILRNTIDKMTEEPQSVERLMHIIRITKKFERIADLSTNICEDVIFMEEGKVIKHHIEEENE